MGNVPAQRRLSHGMFHRDCQHHRHRDFHEPWFSIGEYSIRVCSADALGCRRRRGALRRALLRRTQRCTAALRRRVPFSLEDLSPSARVHGRIRFRDSRICRADRSGRDGVWHISARRARFWLTGLALVRGGLAGRALSS